MGSQWTSVSNIVLRFLGVIFSLVAFSLMASANNGADNKDERALTYASFSAFKYVIATNVVACLYSALHVLVILVSLVSKGWLPGPVEWLHYSTFLLDQGLAYLLFSSSSSGATAIDVLAHFEAGDLSEFYPSASAAVAMGFMASLVFMISAAISGYHYLKS